MIVLGGDMIVLGGSWAKDVALHCAERDGNTELATAMHTQRQAKMAAWRAAGQAIGRVWAARRGKHFVATAGGGNETLIPVSDQLGALAHRVRGLMTQNDPDAVRAGLAEIADALEAMHVGDVAEAA